MTTPVEAIAGMDRAGLLRLWAGMMTDPVPARLSTALMRRILAFEMQSARQGGLPEALRRKLARIAAGEARPKTAGLRPGGRLIREWNGVSHVVEVTESGYLWRGARHRSLSSVARAITGAHWSGPRFFGLATGRPGR